MSVRPADWGKEGCNKMTSFEDLENARLEKKDLETDAVGKK